MDRIESVALGVHTVGHFYVDGQIGIEHILQKFRLLHHGDQKILCTHHPGMGNIKSKSVQINNGAVIEGLCSQCYAEVSPSSFFRE